MRIALDALPLVSSRMTGIGYCEAGQVQAMMMLHPEEQYVLQFFDKGDGVENGNGCIITSSSEMSAFDRGIFPVICTA